MADGGPGGTAPAANDDGWVDALALAGLSPGSVVGCMLRGTQVAVCRLDDGSVRALGNLCTHEYARMSDGWLIGDVLACPFHGGQFDVNTGAGLCAPVEKPLPVYPAAVRDGRVLVQLPRPEEKA